MADINYGQHAPKAVPTTSDEIPLWDVAANQAKKATIANIINARLTGGGIIATGGFTLTVPATGVAMLLGEAQTVTGQKTFTANQVFNALLTAGHLRTRQDTIADDAVLSFAPVASAGILIIGNTTNNSVGGIIMYRAAAGAIAPIIAGLSNLETSTSILSGTTGTDGKVTVSANSNGNIYIENRMGGSLTFRTTFLC